PQPAHFLVSEVFAPQRILARVGAKMRGIRPAASVATDEDELLPLPRREHVGRQPFDLPVIKGPKDLRTPIEILPHIQLCTQHVTASLIYISCLRTPCLNLPLS